MRNTSLPSSMISADFRRTNTRGSDKPSKLTNSGSLIRSPVLQRGFSAPSTFKLSLSQRLETQFRTRVWWFGQRVAFACDEEEQSCERWWLVLLSTLLFLIPAFAEGGSSAPGSMKGEVFTRGRNGEPAVLLDAHISQAVPGTCRTICFQSPGK